MGARVMLTREAILGHVDRRIGSVEVAELGGTIHVASLTAAEADKIRLLDEAKYPASVGMVILGVCDEDGKRLFSEKDAEKLAGLPASAMKVIADAVLRHNGLLAGEADEAKND